MTQPKKPNTIFASDIQLTGPARQLLASLRGGEGDRIAEPKNYPGVQAFGDHAQIYFNNAGTLCESGHAVDFAVFGALYCLRHGLELWLKGFAQNQVLNDVLDAIADGKTLDEVVEVAQRGCSKKYHAARRDELIKALCVLRNVDKGLRHPECHQVEIGEQFARERLSEGIGHESEAFTLALAWPISMGGHDLGVLWEQTKEIVRGNYARAQSNNVMYIGGELLPPEKVEALCALLGAWDKDGDAFRYPCSLTGDWYFHLPSLNLRALGELASAMESTLLCYEHQG